MEIKDIINNVDVFGIENAFQGCKYSFATDVNAVNGEITETIKKLANTPIGSGHDNFLNGILVQFDLTLTNKAWVEAERYHFLDFISSQSTMHRITKFDLDSSYIEYVDARIISIMKEKVKEYNEIMANNKLDPSLTNRYLEILYSNPAGFKITAKMTTNYRQLKTIYKQRKTHKLPEWRVFCKWVETLPYAELIVNEK